MGPIELSHLSDEPFEGLIQAADIGTLRITRIRESCVRSEITADTLRRRERTQSVFVLIQLEGGSINVQDGREAVQRAGEIVLLADRPNVHVSGANDRSLVLELPVVPLERMLGPTRQFTALTFGTKGGTGPLIRSFFEGLVRVHETLTPSSAERMASIGTDLIVAGLAERLAQDVPRPLHGTVLVQRAKAFVEANLSDPTLDPSHLAAAVGVSLRRLQELFHERGQHISDWIWQRRLEAAVERLSDPGCAHIPIGHLSYGCGFANQAHFARRFKERYGLSPSAYRQAAQAQSP
ncbi:transcriptional regulator, AraC family [Methylobacterium pseudosasicola]|uniref:Transcriptional regulator, AraC family n=2 Tax=Methylobacterium pseudosasicola TaxID=582667 RepID=A0A1I4GT03_9HYPH|nr:transcriptional regulator, AraC family [Methylobacterium pseudosasicola]